MENRGLAELHLHLYGCIRAEDYLEFMQRRQVDWSFYKESYEEAYGRRPPIEEILERHVRGDPSAAGDFKRLFVFGDDDAGDFQRFQAKFNLLINGSSIMELSQKADASHSLLGEVGFFIERMLTEQQRSGLGYAEQRLLLSNDFPRALTVPLLEALLARYARASREGLAARLALSLPRDDPWPGWEIAQSLALGPHGACFSGIDFCFVEEGHPPREKAELFHEVAAFNERHPDRALAILYHVGESFRDKSLESAVRWVQEAAELGAHRLGHAIALGIDPMSYGTHSRTESVVERRDQLAYDLRHAAGLRRHGVAVDEATVSSELEALRRRPDDYVVTIPYDDQRLSEVRARQDYAMDRVAASGAVVEVCPTSNLRIGNISDPDHHPVHRFHDRGVPFVVASDDPGIFDTTLRDEIDWVVREAGLDAEAAIEIERRAWDSRSELLSGRAR